MVLKQESQPGNVEELALNAMVDVSRAARNAMMLRRLNVVVLCVAVVVYAGVLGIAAFYRVGPLTVFSTCILLAELLVFQIVRTLCDHLELVRASHGTGSQRAGMPGDGISGGAT
jgi:hypothetical protein